MDITQIIINLVIGLISSLIGGLAVVYYYNRLFLSTTSERQKELAAKWVGVLKQTAENGEKEIPTEFNLDIKWKKIVGTGTFIHSDGTQSLLALDGGFRTNRLLKLDFTNQVKGKIHFGSTIFYLNADADKLEGRIVGYGLKSEKIVSGILILNKEKLTSGST